MHKLQKLADFLEHYINKINITINNLQMAKVIAVDAHGQDPISEIVIQDNITMEEAQALAHYKNKLSSDRHKWHYKAVPSDYKIDKSNFNNN